MPATYEPIATTTLGSAQSSISFTGIPSTYTDLIIIVNAQDSNAFVLIRYNNDSGTNYSRTLLFGDGSSASSLSQTNQTSHFVSVGASNREGQKIQINNYANTSTNKTTLINENRSGQTVGATVGLYRSTSAINRIDFISSTGSASIASGSTFTLYGIKAA